MHTKLCCTWFSDSGLTGAEDSTSVWQGRRDGLKTATAASWSVKCTTSARTTDGDLTTPVPPTLHEPAHTNAVEPLQLGHQPMPYTGASVTAHLCLVHRRLQGGLRLQHHNCKAVDVIIGLQSHAQSPAQLTESAPGTGQACRPCETTLSVSLALFRRGERRPFA